MFIVWFLNLQVPLIVTYICLTHWGRVTHICVSKLTSIDSDNGLAPCLRQAIIWINAGILLIGPQGTNFSEILINILIFSFTKMHLKMSPVKWRPSCLGLNVLRDLNLVMIAAADVLAPSVATVMTMKLDKFFGHQLLWMTFLKSHTIFFFFLNILALLKCYPIRSECGLLLSGCVGTNFSEKLNKGTTISIQEN